MDFTSINIRHIYGAQKYCDKIRICCQYKITVDATVTRDYVCDATIGVISLRQQQSVQARPIFHPDSNIYTEDARPYSGETVTGGNVISCPKIKCWELVSENIGENVTYYADCTDLSVSPCPDDTVTLTDATEFVIERTGWLETSYSRQESADMFGKIISESRQCTKFYYDKTANNIFIAGPLVTINKTRQYNEIIKTTYIYEECE